MRPTNYQSLPVEKRPTIIKAEIADIERKAADNKKKTKKLQRTKAELKGLDNPEALDYPMTIEEVSHADQFNSYGQPPASSETLPKKIISGITITHKLPVP